MNAALYARYSTAMQSEASIADQFRQCERLAERSGFIVVARFSDAAISGGTTHRPGYQQLLAAARRREFTVIVAEDTSRLWRNLAEQAPRVAELRDLGVHVVCHDLDTRQESSVVLGAVLGAMGEGYRQEIGRRTRRGLEGRARAKRPTGGRAYGYVAARDADSGDREIDPCQAEVVRRIFRMYADGYSPRRIADVLNTEGVPSPGSTWQREERRRAGWLVTAIAGDPSRGLGILNNELYIGRVVWNRSRWIRSATDSKRRRCVPNPHSDWVIHTDERLRIVPDALWGAVKARQASRQHDIGERVKAGLSASNAGRTGRRGGFLLSGLLKCSECGANYVIADRSHYACAGRVNGGRSCCGNDGRFRRDDAERQLLAGIREELAQPFVVAEVGRRVRAALKRLADPKAPSAERIGKVQAEIDRLVDAVAKVGASAALAARLRAAEAEFAKLNNQPVSQVVRIAPDVEARYLRMLEQLPAALMSGDREAARARFADCIGPIRVVTTPAAIEFYNEKGRLEAAFMRAAGVEFASANKFGSGGSIPQLIASIPRRQSRSLPGTPKSAIPRTATHIRR